MATGQNLARVANPLRLKAELKIAETQAKDVELGQVAQGDTRNGVIAGRVSRIDPAAQGGQVTVDVAPEGDLPKGAQPDLQVAGTIELERLADRSDWWAWVQDTENMRRGWVSGDVPENGPGF